MSLVHYSIFTSLLIGFQLVYFKIAKRYSILDRPNSRSLHVRPTIRGGGIIFYFSLLGLFVFKQQPSLLFLLSLTLIAGVGFADDIKSLSSALRFFVQAMAIALAFYDVGLSGTDYWLLILILVVSIGTLNAFNFMDGINGLTGGYSVVILSSLLYINQYRTYFINSDFLIAILIGVVIFCFFNFRKKAICFAGDVGSLSIGFLAIYLSIKLIITARNPIFILLLSVYGVDTVLTIVHRLLRKENIFKAHRSHLYQTIVSNTNVSHIQMTVIYMLAQLVCNAILFAVEEASLQTQLLTGATLLVVLASAYIGIKWQVLKRADVEDNTHVS